MHSRNPNWRKERNFDRKMYKFERSFGNAGRSNDSPYGGFSRPQRNDSRSQTNDYGNQSYDGPPRSQWNNYGNQSDDGPPRSQRDNYSNQSYDGPPRSQRDNYGNQSYNAPSRFQRDNYGNQAHDEASGSQWSGPGDQHRGGPSRSQQSDYGNQPSDRPSYSNQSDYGNSSRFDDEYSGPLAGGKPKNERHPAHLRGKDIDQDFCSYNRKYSDDERNYQRDDDERFDMDDDPGSDSENDEDHVPENHMNRPPGGRKPLFKNYRYSDKKKNNNKNKKGWFRRHGKFRIEIKNLPETVETEAIRSDLTSRGYPIKGVFHTTLPQKKVLKGETAPKSFIAIFENNNQEHRSVLNVNSMLGYSVEITEFFRNPEKVKMKKELFAKKQEEKRKNKLAREAGNQLSNPNV